MLLNHHNWPFTFLNFKFSETYEIPEDDLNNHRNMLEWFKCFNINNLDKYFIVYRSELDGT